jgi:hypothetical protein
MKRIIRILTRRRRILVFALACLGGLVMPHSAARADFIQSFSGNTFPSSTGSSAIDGTINFGVLNRTGGTASDPWNTGYSGSLASKFVAGVTASGTSSPALDLGAKYLYVFQVTNNGTNSQGISRAIINIFSPGAVTSWGALKGVGLKDSNGLVSATNPFGTLGAPGNPASASTGVTGPKLDDISSSKTHRVQSVILFQDNIEGNWPNIPSGFRTTVFLFTSNLPPILDGGSIAGKSPHDADGTVPTPMPEPYSFVLAGLGLPLAWLLTRRRITVAGT